MPETGTRLRLTVDADGIVTLGALRKRCWRSLTPAVAADVGLTLADCDRFLHMAYTPPRDVLLRPRPPLGPAMTKRPPTKLEATLAALAHAASAPTRPRMSTSPSSTWPRSCSRPRSAPPPADRKRELDS